MHKYRSQARELAWYDEEGQASSHNPFKKIRPKRHHRSDSIQLESGLVSSRSLGELCLSEDQRRRQEMTSGLGGPEHSGTFPLDSAGSDHGTPRSPPEPSMASQDPINVSTTCGDDSETIGSSQTRQRKGGILGNFAHRHSDDDWDDKKSLSEPQTFTLASQLRATILNSWINVLLVAAPVGIALYAVKANPIAVFVVNFIAIMYAFSPSATVENVMVNLVYNSPLAAMLSFATEEIALRTGETIGGLLNASFGNAVELIVAIIALVQKKTLIVQTSLIGSILSNLLLVLGMCFFLGGIDRMEQHFNVTVAQTAASMLALAVSSLIIPTAYHKWSNLEKTDGTAALSRGTSVLLLIVYGCYLFFQLKSHSDMYNRPSPKVERRRAKVAEGDASRGIAQIGKMTAVPLVGSSPDHMQMEEPEDETEQPQLSVTCAVLTLIISTAFVAACAEFMVESIDALTATGNIGETFVGLILLPIVGNAAEHATAVTVACKDKMDLSIGVAVGSSMQIALLVLPLIIVLGWIIGVEDMTLNFDGFQVIVLFVSVLLVNYLIGDGKSHWLEGVLLMMMYLIIAIASWFFV
ncbi:Sodium/calcium exchanger membrane region [Penicillium paradoxum]|uniref:Sodium/calcium exchanger membrane region n=1 Tax=Penicillium paradoxum TaxID=176176 RepID=UPI002549B099|nr:Sodium/calcium exchanger membrane region [Penicillium paradoxum]KAJ5779125.1 Sodium/calcium exchanger membrane region [Penicillium paradoxum]